jgi:NADPH-dependent F420 reductase
MMGARAGKPAIGVIGGAGALGSALARRWARAGYPVIIGSRDPARARDTAARLARAAGGEVAGDNYAAAAAAEIVVITVPFAAQAGTIEAIRPSLRGQLLLDTTVPLALEGFAASALHETGSAAVAAQHRLGRLARVVSAFHNVPARRLAKDEPIDCDVLVFGDDPADREAVIRLAIDAGLRGIHGGPLANSLAAEAMTSVLIGINRYYRRRVAGIRITGLD